MSKEDKSVPHLPILRLGLLFGAALLAGCSTPSPDGTNGGTEQLRLSMTPALRNAGVSDACIQQLPLSTLASVKNTTNRSLTSSMGYLQRQQRIRTTVRKVCPDL